MCGWQCGLCSRRLRESRRTNVEKLPARVAFLREGWERTERIMCCKGDTLMVALWGIFMVKVWWVLVFLGGGGIKGYGEFDCFGVECVSADGC